MIKRAYVLLTPIVILSILCSFQNPSPSSAITDPLKTIVIDAGHGLPDGGAYGNYSNESQLTLAIALKLGERLKEVLPDSKIIYTRTTEELPNGITDANQANRYRAQMANENHGNLFISIHVNSAANRYSRKVVGHKKETYYAYSGKGKSRKKIKRTRTVPVYQTTKLSCGRKGTETYIWAVNKYEQKLQSVGSRDDGEMFGEHDTTGGYDQSPQDMILASLRTKKFFDQSLNIASFVEEEFTKLGRTSYGVKQRNHKGIWVLQATNMPSILVETGFICTPEEEDYLNSEKGQNEISYAVMRAVLRYKEALSPGSTEAVKDAYTTKK